MSIIDDYLADKSKLEKELEDCRHANGIGTGRELSEAEQTAWMRADTECSVRREELRRKYFPGSTAWSEPRTELDIPDIAKPADLWYIVHEELLPGFPNALRFARTRDFSARLNRALQQVCSVLLHRFNIVWSLPKNTLTTKKAFDELKKIEIRLRSEADAAERKQPSQAGAMDAEPKLHQSKGPPVQFDPAADRRLCADWKAAKGQGLTREAFARARGISVNDIIAAQNREKYRRQRDAE